MTAMRTVRIVHGPGERIDRPGLRFAAPQTPAQLDAWCIEWAAAHGWVADSRWCTTTAGIADAVVAAGTDAVILVVVDPAERVELAAAISHDGCPPLVELHVGDLRRRGIDPQDSPLPVMYGIHGRGTDGYRDAIDYVAHRWRWPPRTVSYGPAPEQVADVRVPEDPAGPHGVAVLFHGGFWLDAWSRDTCDALAIDLTERGIATVNAEYRRRHTGTWADTADDARALAAWVHATGPTHGLAPQKMVLVGHSAGGQLVLWLAAQLTAEGCAPALTVGLAPIVDLERARAEHLGGGAVAAFFGDGPLADADPRQQLPAAEPTLLAHGTADHFVPIEHTRVYAEAAGKNTQFFPTGGDHFGLINPNLPSWDRIASEITNVAATAKGSPG